MSTVAQAGRSVNNNTSRAQARTFAVVDLLGRLGRDPELTYTASGLAVTKLNLAVGRPRRAPNGQSEWVTDWYRVTAFDELAETIARTLRKGTLVSVQGKLQSNSYVDRTGVNRTSVEIVAHAVEPYTPPGGDSGYDDVEVPF